MCKVNEINNKQYSNGNTFLHINVLNGNENMCKYLLKYQANINIPNDQNQTALQLSFNYPKICLLFYQHILNVSEERIENEMAKQSQRNHQLRVCLLGSQAAGKTTLISLLQHSDITNKIISILPFVNQNKIFTSEMENKATDGIEITNLGNVSFWDFGGQEILHSTHQFFLTEQAQYLIVVYHMVIV